MSTAPKIEPVAESSPGAFGPHLQDLQEFFRAKGLSFGSVEDLQPFVERLDSDASFCDEMASMVRTIIYRERDGLSHVELMDLLATAVGGSDMDNAAAPEVRDAVRRLMTFIEGVFRTRWVPGAPVRSDIPTVGPEEPERLPEPVQEMPAEAASPVHPMTDLFLRAQMVANGGVEETMAAERPKESAPLEEPAQTSQQEYWHVPLDDFAKPEVERGSRVWLWIAGTCALLLAFSAGLIAHQRLIVPLRDANQPYESAPAATTPAQAPAAAPPAARPTGTAVDADWRARAGSAKAVRAGEPGTGLRKAGGSEEFGSEADLQPRYLSPAVIGASPALMASRLLYAPPASYPALAKMTHVQGRVMVQAVVGKSGRVIRANAISGHRLLRGAAVREVYERRYRPYLLDDRPRDVATIVTIDFRLK